MSWNAIRHYYYYYWLLLYISLFTILKQTHYAHERHYLHQWFPHSMVLKGGSNLLHRTGQTVQTPSGGHLNLQIITVHASHHTLYEILDGDNLKKENTSMLKVHYHHCAATEKNAPCGTEVSHTPQNNNNTTKNNTYKNKKKNGTWRTPNNRQ